MTSLPKLAPVAQMRRGFRVGPFFGHVTLLLCSVGATPLAAQDLRLQMPLDCELGETCFVQQYVDVDPGPAARDFTGGPLSYDGHQGTDFRVADLEALAEAPPVLAPADGRVRGVRDGVADGTFPEGQDCGNGIAIDHGGGWTTQLCHFANGSIRVSEGDTVRAGQPIARMGMTGRTQFPHVHITVRHDGMVVDPFVAKLWEDPPVYEPGGLLSAGFSDAIPDYEEVKAGSADAAVLPSTSPALVIWASAFGGQPGDVLSFTIEGPDGRQVFQSDVVLERTQAQLFRAVGRRLTQARWRGGLYTGTIVLSRTGEDLDRLVTTVDLE